MGMLWYTVYVGLLIETSLFIFAFFNWYWRTWKASGNRLAFLALWITWGTSIALLVSGKLFVFADWLASVSH